MGEGNAGVPAPLPEPAKPPNGSRYIHSDIYDRLVKNEKDLIGMIAYGLYQSRKRVWISNFERDRERSPSVDEVKDYCYTQHQAVLNGLKTDAGNILASVVEEIIIQRFPDIQKNAINAEIKAQLEKINGKVGHLLGYSHHIVGHIAGFVVLVLFVWLASLIVHYEPSIANFVTRI